MRTLINFGGVSGVVSPCINQLRLKGTAGIHYSNSLHTFTLFKCYMMEEKE